MELEVGGLTGAAVVGGRFGDPQARRNAAEPVQDIRLL
jgi:hypothetical protein